MCCLSLTTAAGAGTELLIVAPERWLPAASNFVAFKRSLGIAVTNSTTESIAAGGALTPPLIRGRLQSFAAALPAGTHGCVLFVGDFAAVPAPQFQVAAGDPLFNSDIYYRDLHSDFDRNTDNIFGEFGTNAATCDFDPATFAAAFAAISNDLVVGRLPIPSNATPDGVAALLNASVAFERETGARKYASIMSAGRIVVSDTPLLYADSWDYALKGLVTNIYAAWPDRTPVTVVHMDSNYADRTHITVAVEGSDVATDYTRGQNVVRRSLGIERRLFVPLQRLARQATYDFALRSNGQGFPTNVRPAVGMSMSCASYPLASAACTSGLTVAFLASAATVTPDVENLLMWGGRMVSGEVQKRAAIGLFCQWQPVEAVFRDSFDYYVSTIMTAGFGIFFANNRAAVLRNVLGFQVIGDPTLAHAYPDQDGDGLLDPQEDVLGTSPTDPDSDDDGLPDGLKRSIPPAARRTRRRGRGCGRHEQRR